MGAGDYIAAGALLLSIIVAVRSEMGSRRAAAQAADAEAAAVRSTEAAERSAQALERMADQWAESLSRQEKRDQRQWFSRPSRGTGGPPMETRGGGRGPWAGPMPDEPQGPVVHWTVDRVSGSRYQLKNLGQATALGAHLTSDNAVRFDGPDVQDITMGSAVEFLAMGSMQTGTPELVVRWREGSDPEPKTWRRPLPRAGV